MDMSLQLAQHLLLKSELALFVRAKSHNPYTQHSAMHALTKMTAEYMKHRLFKRYDLLPIRHFRRGSLILLMGVCLFSTSQTGWAQNEVADDATSVPSAQQSTASPSPKPATSNLSPKEVAQAYMSAVNQSNWKKAAAQMHPHSLAVIHKVFVNAVESSDDQQTLLALYQVPDLAAFKSLTPADFFIRFMTSVLNQDPNFAEAMSHIVFTVNDEERLSDNEVLVSYTATIDAAESVVSDTDTLVLRYSSLGWKIYSTPDLKPLLEQAEVDTE